MKGWIQESRRHSLARQGIRSGRKIRDTSFTRTNLAIDLKDTSQYKFGSAAWQTAIVHNINEKLKKKEKLGVTEKTFVRNEAEFRPGALLDIEDPEINMLAGNLLELELREKENKELQRKYPSDKQFEENLAVIAKGRQKNLEKLDEALKEK
jgi:hypothetical protein